MLYPWIFGYKVSKARLFNQLEIADQGGYSCLGKRALRKWKWNTCLFKTQTWTALSESSNSNDAANGKTLVIFSDHQASSWVKTMLRNNKTLGYPDHKSRKLENKKSPDFILPDTSNQLNSDIMGTFSVNKPVTPGRTWSTVNGGTLDCSSSTQKFPWLLSIVPTHPRAL